MGPASSEASASEVPDIHTSKPCTHRRWSYLIALGSLATSACHGSSSETAAVPAHPSVLVVVMDGVRLEESLGVEASSATGELPSAMLPVIWDELLPEAVVADDAWNIGATITAPAHVTILSGRRQQYANFPMEDGAGLYRPALPGLHEELQHRGEFGVGASILTANTRLLEGLTHSLWTWNDEASVPGAELLIAYRDDGEDETVYKDDQGVLALLRSRMRSDPVDFALVNLHRVDLEGHFGESDAYPEAVRVLDEPVADLWGFVQDSPRYADVTWMVVLADHGRHTVGGGEPIWRHHGCQCTGCRRIPFMLLGPGVRAGGAVDGPLLLTDVAPTLAALRGVSMPWADGLVRDDLLEIPTGIASRGGLAGVARAGGVEARLVYQDDPSHRKQLEVEGALLSSPDAVEVEGPVMAASDGETWLCFRELILTPGTLGSQWEARCMHSADQGLSWENIPAPAKPVGPWWRPAMVPDADGLMLVYALNPNGLANLDSVDGDGGYEIEAAYWNGRSWTSSQAGSTPIFPSGLVAMERASGELLVALAGSRSEADARHRRALFTAKVTLSDGQPSWGEFGSTRMDELPIAGEALEWRVEAPALGVDADGAESMAAVGFNADGSHAILAWGRSPSGWRMTESLALPGSPLPHLGPVWFGGRPVWAVRDPLGQALLCAAVADEDPACVAMGSERVLTMSATDDSLLVIVDRGEGWWELQELHQADFSGP